MDGWLGAIGSMFSWLGGEGIGASLARVGLGMFVARYLNKNNESAAASSSSSTPAGTRQQISASTDNKRPIAYGDNYFSGTITDVRSVNDNKELFAVLDLCEKTGDIFSTDVNTPANRTMSDIIIDDIYINNQRVVFAADGTTVDHTVDDTGVIDTNLQNLVGIYLYKGSSNDPMLPCATGTRTAIAGTVPPVAYQVMPGWDNAYTMSNIVFAIVKINFDPNKGVHALPTLKFHVRNTMNKPHDVEMDYMTNMMYGARISESRIDKQAFIDWGTYADEAVTLGSFPAQPRYRINGLARTTETVMSNMDKIASAGGAFLTYDINQGKWSVVVNKETAKTLEFDDGNILGTVAVRGAGMSAKYNKVEVQFQQKILKDQYDYVRFDLPEQLRNANEPDNTLQLTHEFVNDPIQATILANLDLRQARESTVATFKTDYSKYNVSVGAVIGVTNPVTNWVSKQFRVIRIKKNESDSGQLTLELTCQSYNPDVYTVEDISDFVPLIGIGHSLPSITPIQRPLAPTVTSQTLSSQPSISITGIVPEGVVSEMKFYQTLSTDADSDAVPYTLIGTVRPENSGLFTIGDVVTFRTVELQSGTYKFKIKASYNGVSESKYSPPSASLAYTYVQAPDVLKYTTPVVDSSGTDPTSGSGNGALLGMLAYQLGSKLNWFGNGGIFSGNANIANIFGLNGSQVSSIDKAVQADKTTLTAPLAYDKALAGSTALSSTTSQTLKFRGEGGIVVTGDAGTNTVIITGTGSGTGGNTGNTGGNTGTGGSTVTSTLLKGHVFPCLFGSGNATTSGSRVGIFTHDHAVIGGSAAASVLKANNVVSSSKTLTPSVSGQIQHFYNLPGVSSFAQKPFYDEAATDRFTANTQVTLYYSTATYTSGNLDQQSWSAWKKVSSNNGVTGFEGNLPGLYANVWTNPAPTISNIDAPYIVEEIKQTDGVGNVALFPTEAVNNYDPFKPNILKVIQGPPIPVSNRDKTVYVSTTGDHVFAGGANDLIIFGTSVYNLPDNTPFSNNTLFGHQADVYVQAYPEAKSLRQIAASSSMFVGIDATTDKVYYSKDGKDWTKIKYDADVSSEDPDWIATAPTDVSNPDSQVIPPFKFVAYDGSKFIVYGYGDQIATSTDGKVWTEVHTTAGLDTNTSHLIIDSGKYLACSIYGVQSSTDGITWTAIHLPGAMGSRGPDCGVWDGSKFVVGNQWSNNSGSVLYSSVDATSWIPIEGLNNPSNAQRVSASENAALNESLNLRNVSTIGSLP